MLTKKQFLKPTSVPGWPPMVIDSTESGVPRFEKPESTVWTRAFVAMPSATQAASELVVGAAETKGPTSPTGPKASTTASWKIGAVVRSHIARAGVATQPVGRVIEYR